jgi:uncharacterized protein (DUF2141 family)
MIKRILGNSIFYPICLFCCEIAQAQLTIELSGIKEKKSNIWLAVYHNADDFLTENRYREYIFPAYNSAAHWIIRDLPPGRYAISVYQDLNDNQKLDRGIFNQPVEPFGFSNSKHPYFRSPTFEQCDFNFTSQMVLHIELK